MAPRRGDPHLVLGVRPEATDQEVRRFTGHTTLIRSIQFSSDGRRIATSAGALQIQQGKPVPTDCTVRIWDVDAGKAALTLTGNAGPVLAAAFSPDGRWLAAASRRTPAGKGATDVSPAEMTRRMQDLMKRQPSA